MNLPHVRMLLLSTLFAAQASVGCKQDPAGPPAAGSASAAAPTGGSAGPSAAERASEQAVSTGVEAYNQIVKVTSRVAKEYLSAVGGEAPPKLEAMTSHWCSSCDRPEALLKDAIALVERLAAAPPAGAMAALPGKLAALRVAASALLAAAADTKPYYGAETFKTDQGKRGLELHAAFLDKQKAYRQAVREVSALFDQHERARLVAELARYEADKRASYWFRKCTGESKVALSALRGDDKAAIEPAVAAVKTCLDGYQAYAAAAGAGLHTAVKGHVNNVASFLELATRTARDLADPKTPGYRLDADFQNLGPTYNGLVQTTNALYDLEAGGSLK